MKIVTWSHLSVLVIRYNFYNILWKEFAKIQNCWCCAQKISPFWASWEMSLKTSLNFLKVPLNHLLMPVSRYNSKIIQLSDLEKSSKVLILCPKLPILGINRIFLKSQNSLSKLLFNACHLAQFSKTLIKRFLKSSNVLILCQKMTHFPHFGHNNNFPKNLKQSH